MKFACCTWCNRCDERVCLDNNEGRVCKGCGGSLCDDCECPNDECEESPDAA